MDPTLGGTSIWNSTSPAALASNVPAEIFWSSVVMDANWHNQNWIIQKIGRRQAIREAWSLFKGSHETSFQEYINSQFLIADSDSSEDQ